MATPELPVSMRTARGERRYQAAKQNGDTVPLNREKVIIDYLYWKLINNRFPGDMIFKKHHMLIPKREFSSRDDMLPRERRELDKIIRTYAQYNYHLIFENMNSRRSVLHLWHLHLAEYYSNREEICL